MRQHQSIRRVIAVVIDGLRADAIPLFPLPNLRALARDGAATFAARTVTPSITTAAMTSLFTGIAPRLHGVTSDRFAFPAAGPHLVPMPRWLHEHGLPMHAYMAALPRPFRGLGERLAVQAGFSLTFAGPSADEILAAALPDLRAGGAGCFLLHWPEADRAGHASGWTSQPYREAAWNADRAIGRLAGRLDLHDDPSTVLMVLSDHGGGGRVRNDHDSLHPMDTTIPLIIAGAAIAPGELAPTTSLLDVPATIAWMLTGRVPSSWQGRILVEAMAPHPAGKALAR